MTIGDFFGEFYWAFLFGIPLFLIYLRISSNKNLGGLSLKDSVLFFKYGLIGLAIFLVQNYIFSDHFYFVTTLPIYIIILSLLIYILLLKRDVMLIENTMDSENFKNINTMEKFVSMTRQNNVWVMDRSVFENLKHVGEQDYRFFKASSRLYFCDYFDQKNGVIYHPQVGELHNVSFYMAKSFWLALKELLPDIIRTNTLLTWLEPFRVAKAQETLKDEFIYRLANLEKRYEKDRFNLEDSLKEQYKKEEKRREETKKNQDNLVPIQIKNDGGNNDE